MTFTTNFKSDAPTRLDRKQAKAALVSKSRREAYRIVEIRDAMQCRACGRRVVRTSELRPDALEHHHIRGRGGKNAETTGNLILLCRECHELRHLKRELSISGNADQQLTFEYRGRTWRG